MHDLLCARDGIRTAFFWLEKNHPRVKSAYCGTLHKWRILSMLTWNIWNQFIPLGRLISSSELTNNLRNCNLALLKIKQRVSGLDWTVWLAMLWWEAGFWRLEGTQPQGHSAGRVICPKLNVFDIDPLSEGMKVKAMGKKQLLYLFLILISTGW